MNCRIQETNVLTKFHEDWANKKTAPPPGGHVFTPMMTIFELVRDIYKIDAKPVTSRKTHFLTKFHEDWTKNVTSSTIFKLVRDINKTNVLTKFYDDWANIVTSRLFTRFIYIHIMNTAPPPGGHVFQQTETIFEPTYYLRKHFDKFHGDRTINVASRVFTRQNVDDGQKAITKAHHEYVVLR
ncbi:hypothetical protein DPMN_162030 [Dreissena polymorpha]|uniref:Uncharacterized protein n=1 Tax=Dreissena polymorpha TaxID=45954 RepID=A0A9D4EQY1_DREPO|nr:hypothetical protein DPMN_162030 [Dreissena polymorpha]